MSGWDMLTMMLAGIALLKSGVLSGERSSEFYWKLLLYGYAAGLPIGAYSAYRVWAAGFEPMQSVLTFSTYQTARIAMTMGHMSALLLLYKAGVLRGLFGRLAAIGQTAFSNYIELVPYPAIFTQIDLSATSTYPVRVLSACELWLACPFSRLAPIFFIRPDTPPPTGRFRRLFA